MKRLATTIALAALAALAWASPAVARAEVELTPAGGDAFPQRSFVLTLPEGIQVERSAIRVRENGRPVRDLVAAPAGEVTKSGIVLAIDASDSMRGRPIRDAVSAAQAFAGQVNPDQQIGIVAFNRRVTTLAELGTDRGESAAALAKPPPLASGTHIYDAVGESIGMLKANGIAGGAVVLLSDGGDTDSRIGAAALAARARAAGVRLFTVGLRSRSFDTNALRGLAAKANGEYSQAGSPRELKALYTQLGARLSNDFILNYRSSTRPGERVTVAALVAGIRGAATSTYMAQLPGRAGDRDAEQSGFWASTTTMIVISLAGAGLIAGAFVILMLSWRRRGVRSRVGGFVSLPEGVDPATWGSALTQSVVKGAERALEGSARWDAIKEEVEIARVRLPAAQLVVATASVTAILGTLLLAMTGSLLGALMALVVPVAVNIGIRRRARQQRQLFGEQLADNLQVVASAMRAGHSFVGALSVAADDAGEPARTELGRAVADEQLGVPLEEALRTVMRRMRNADLEQVILVGLVQRESGGNTAEVIDRVAATIRERAALRRMIDTLTAQGQLSRWIVSLLPVGLLLLVSAINPTYMSPLYETGVGNVLLVVCAALLVSGSLVIKRIVNIKI
jgi:tight adherence protein B